MIFHCANGGTAQLRIAENGNDLENVSKAVSTTTYGSFQQTVSHEHTCVLCLSLSQFHQRKHSPEVGGVQVAGILSDLKHLRPEPGQVKRELREAQESCVEREALPERPVIRSVREGGDRPLSQHAARHHVVLHVLQYIAQHLVRDLTYTMTSQLVTYERHDCVVHKRHF